MKKLSLTIVQGEQPPSKLLVSGIRDELEKLKHTLSGACTAALGLVLVGFVGLQWAPVHSVLGETASSIAFVVGLVSFLVGRQYEIVLNNRLAEASPIPDNLLAEAAALCNASPVAQEYIAGLRIQQREMTLAELHALKKLLAATPTAVAREALYG
jgi:hypothetical protein